MLLPHRVEGKSTAITISEHLQIFSFTCRRPGAEETGDLMRMPGKFLIGLIVIRVKSLSVAMSFVFCRTDTDAAYPAKPTKD